MVKQLITFLVALILGGTATFMTYLASDTNKLGLDMRTGIHLQSTGKETWAPGGRRTGSNTVIKLGDGSVAWCIDCNKGTAAPEVSLGFPSKFRVTNEK